MDHFRGTTRAQGQHGFSLLELVVALGIIVVVLGTSLPLWFTSQRSYGLMNDARAIAEQLNLARVRAASDFTEVRVNFNLADGNYQLQLWDKATNSFDLTEGGTQYLSGTSNFGFATISSPAGTQTTIQQSPQIIFNSMGVAVDSTGAATGNYAIYLSNRQGQFSAVSVSVSGKVSIWRWTGSSWQAY